ncbi:hypothetical protein [Deinococcus sp.]|uniref:hypothetical protein n=1 Tax=Deinococcus sp. TaxID=47478 RepID=UPI003B5A7784
MSDLPIEVVLLSEASADAWESLGAATRGLEVPSGRAAWLLEHLRDTKLEIWTLIALATGKPPPPELPLAELCDWEVQTVQSLSGEERQRSVVHSGRTFDVSGLLCQSARHTVWHAGQLAALLARSP